MQQKSINNVTMESKAYNLLKEIKESGTLFNSDHIYCNPPQLLENENNKKETINNLKSMLLLNLEVIKEQADQLLSKDKQIAKLKKENDELRARLEKYEQRRSQSKRSDNKDSRKGRRKDKAGTSNETQNSKEGGDKKNNTSGLVTSNNSRLVSGIEFLPQQQLQPVNGTPGRYRQCISPDDVTPKKLDNFIDPYEFVDDDKTPKLIKREKSDPISSTTPLKQKKVKKSAFMTTKNEYLICDWKKSEAELDAEAEPKVRATLELPIWNVRESQSLYAIEGTEDMCDATFEKRHVKCETDERRRKKWDVQRLREHKLLERLKKRYHKDDYDDKGKSSNNKNDSKCNITSFYPSIENVKYIQIVDELPVTAFGEPIPCLEETDFILPWITNPDLSNMSPSTSFTKTRFFKKN